jgi:hypothetical protein
MKSHSLSLVVLGALTILSSTVVTSVFQQQAYGTSDQSETDTEQQLNEKNIGSGESINNNCAGNSIDSNNFQCSTPPGSPSPPPPVEICGNGVDDDGDGLIDLRDPDCARPPPPTPEICENGIDDDGDGIIDEDPGCIRPPPPTAEFNVSGRGSQGSVECDPPAPEGEMFLEFSAIGDGMGGVNGMYTISHPTAPFSRTEDITAGTTDGSTFTLSAEKYSICTPVSLGQVTISGDCGDDVTIRYEDASAVGTFTGDVECITST